MSITTKNIDYPLDRRLFSLPITELPLNRRQQLSGALNVEQIIVAESGLCRDFRGVVQQLKLPYAEIAKLERMIDPFGTLLSYGLVASELGSVGALLQLIANIGRFDVLDDLVPGLVDDLEHLEGRRAAGVKTDQLLHYDASLESSSSKGEATERTLWYDAYVCYADSDLDFVRRLTEHLESPAVGFRLFLRDRDLLGGAWVYETFAQLIESQCRRVIVILSPEFLLSPDCKFQAQFATGLAIEKRSRVLIPVIYKQCSIPSIIRLLTKIDMTSSTSSSSSSSQGKIPEWSMNRLVRSIQDTSQEQQQQQQQQLQQQQLPHHLPTAQPLITYADSRTSIASPSSSCSSSYSRSPSSSSSSTPNIVELSSSSSASSSTASSVIDLQASLPSPPQHDPWKDSLSGPMSTTASTLSSLTVIGDDDDDQRHLITTAGGGGGVSRRSVGDENANRAKGERAKSAQAVSEKSSNTQRSSGGGSSRSRDWFDSIKRKMKVKL